MRHLHVVGSLLLLLLPPAVHAQGGTSASASAPSVRDSAGPDAPASAVQPQPVAATRLATRAATRGAALPTDSTRRVARFCDRLDVFDHYTGRAARWGGVLGAAAGVGWAIVQSTRREAGLAAPGSFLVGPALGGALGVGVGGVAGLGQWGWAQAHGRAWQPDPAARARRDGLLCHAEAPRVAPPA